MNGGKHEQKGICRLRCLRTWDGFELMDLSRVASACRANSPMEGKAAGTLLAAEPRQKPLLSTCRCDRIASSRCISFTKYRTFNHLINAFSMECISQSLTAIHLVTD